MVKFEVVLASDEAAIVWAALNAGIAKAPAVTDQPPAASPQTAPADKEPACASSSTADQTPAEPPCAEPASASSSTADQTPAEPPTAKAPSAADRGQQRADVLMGIFQDRMRGNRPQRTPIEIIVTVPLDGLRGSAEPANLAMMADGEVIAASTARRLCCDAGIVVAHVDAHSQPLSIGRKSRTISAAIKRHCGCVIVRAVSLVARTAATLTAITSSIGPTAAKPRCRTSCCYVVLIILCCTKAAAALKPTVAMAGISSTIATSLSKHSRRAPAGTMRTSGEVSRYCAMPMRGSPSRPTAMHQNGLANRSTTHNASTTWCDAQRYPNATNAQAGTFRDTEKGNGHTRIGAAAPAIPPPREARQLPETRA